MIGRNVITTMRITNPHSFTAWDKILYQLYKFQKYYCGDNFKKLFLYTNKEIETHDCDD